MKNLFSEIKTKVINKAIAIKAWIIEKFINLKNKLQDYYRTLQQRAEDYAFEQSAYQGFHADVNQKTLEKPIWKTHFLLFTVLAFIFVGLIWAKFAILDEVTHGEGKVIPSSQVQIIQNMEGGIIQKIFVKEGDVVKANQILMQIDNTRFLATFDEGEEKRAALKLKILQLEAEINNKPLSFPDDLVKKYPKKTQETMMLYNNRLDQLKEFNETYKLAKEQLNMMQPLVKQGAVSPVEVIQQKTAVADANTKLIGFKADALSQLSAAKADYDGLLKTRNADEDRLDRTTVRSPVKGIVKQLKITTIGGVVQPGADLLEIVPLDDTLLIEARINPADVGFIHPKQQAMVKITAYDFSIYGGLEAKVEQISADTLMDEENKPYYLVRVRTHKSYLTHRDKHLPIIPGMHASIDIITGEKSVLDYLLKPIIKTKDTALRER